MARLKPTHAQSCAYCHQDFIPTRRGTQRFCSGGCRTTYSRKLKAGTLGKLTRLPTPAAVQRQQTPSFGKQVLAAGTGALAANAVSQTAEYFAVTKGLVQEVAELKSLVVQLLNNQAHGNRGLFTGMLTLLEKAGIPANTARVGLGLAPMPEIKPPVKVQPDWATMLRDLG